MPYIKKNERSQIDEAIDNMPLYTPGKLNYAITRMIQDYILDRKEEQGVVRYQDINDVIGALEGAKLEFYRRYAAKFEDSKKKENGDVY
jgi:hypothetical protein